MTKDRLSHSVRWIHEVKVEGEVAFRAGRRGSELVADWPGLGTLTCAKDGSGASFEPSPGASPRDIGKLQRAQVRGLLRDLAGQITVHASAAAIGEHAVLFVGLSGAGKSTAAAEMCFGHGAQLLADDATSLEVAPSGVFVLPSEEEHWLTHHSRTALGIAPSPDEAGLEKRNLAAPKVARRPYPLALVVALRFDPSISRAVLRPLRGGDAARLMLEAAIRFDVEDGEARCRELEQLTTIYRCAPFFELARPVIAPGGVAAFIHDALGFQRS
jgi:hypothetical protein